MEYPWPSSILSFEIEAEGSKLDDFKIQVFLNGKKQKICKKSENFDPSKDECTWRHFSDTVLPSMQTDSYTNLCRFGTDYPMDSTKLLMVYSLFGLMIFVMILGSIALIMSIEQRKGQKIKESIKRRSEFKESQLHDESHDFLKGPPSFRRNNTNHQ